MDNNEEYGYYNKERGTVFNDIEQFLQMTLTYFEYMEASPPLLQRDAIAAKLQPLIKSLRLLHALYGYPEKNDKQGTSMNKDAVKDLVNTLRVGENKEKGFEYYCPSVRDNHGFWAFGFENGDSKLESLLREPAYMFLEMVRNLFRDHKEAGVISKEFLRTLRGGNRLRPVVWAERRDNPERYGVSLGVQHFARPLYLHTKLRLLPNVGIDPQVVTPLTGVTATAIRENDNQTGVTATAIRENDNKKQPCITCQHFFGFLSFPIIGNCAEYDVIGNVQSDLLQKVEWQQFEAACQQHLEAFNTMMQDIHINNLPDKEDILRGYFKNTRHPNRPKVLKYQWNSEAKGGFELIALDKWW